jgi:hypothetical protein
VAGNEPFRSSSHANAKAAIETKTKSLNITGMVVWCTMSTNLFVQIDLVSFLKTLKVLGVIN